MLALPNPAQLGTVINSAMTRREARQALFRAGWRYLDGGSFSSVWLAPDGSRVIKVTKPDAGSLATLEASFACKSPNLPRCYGKVELSNGGFAVEVERLSPIGMAGYRERYPEISAVEHNRTEAMSPQLQEAAAALHAAARKHGCAWDLHDGNVMLRSNGEGLLPTLVLTDLLYEPEQFSRGVAGCRGTKADAASVAQECSDEAIERLMTPVYDTAA